MSFDVNFDFFMPSNDTDPDTPPMPVIKTAAERLQAFRERQLKRKAQRLDFESKRRRLDIIFPRAQALEKPRQANAADLLEYASGAGVEFFLESSEAELHSVHQWWRNSACRPPECVVQVSSSSASTSAAPVP